MQMMHHTTDPVHLYQCKIAIALIIRAKYVRYLYKIRIALLIAKRYCLAQNTLFDYFSLLQSLAHPLMIYLPIIESYFIREGTHLLFFSWLYPSEKTFFQLI